jgi:hypothetical protein
MKTLIVLFALAVPCLSQTVVHLRASGPAGVQLDPSTGVSNTTPVVVHTLTPHGFNVGDKVVVGGACAGAGPSTANGIRLVKASSSNDATHYAITDLAGADIPAGGAPCDGSVPVLWPVPGPMWTGKLSDFTLPAGPLGWYDGTTGPVMRKLALTTLNGLTSLIVSGTTATVTTSYTHGVSAGDQISVWGAGAGGSAVALNTHNGLGAGRPYTVLASPAPTATTFAFTVAGVAPGTYSGVNNACGAPPTPNNLIGTTEDCLVVSQLAYIGNPFWDSVLAESVILNLNTGIQYKHVFDGGINMQSSLQTTMMGWMGVAAVQFLVDRANQHWLDILLYWMKNPERVAGVNWNGFEAMSESGNGDLSDYASYVFYGMAAIWPIGHPYQLAADGVVTRDKIYNDLDDPSLTPCNRSHTDVSDPTGNHRVVLGSGTARGGDSTHITLAVSDSRSTGFYVNNVVIVNGTAAGLITAYDSTTKSATVTPAWAAPGSTDTYAIYTSISIASTAAGATTTMTGYNTHFTTEISVGDAILGANAWPQTNVAEMSYVTAVNSDTSLTVINGASPLASSTASLAWYLQKWQTGDCGCIQEQKHWFGYPSAQPRVYAGGGSEFMYGATIGQGSNNANTLGASHTMLGLAMAADEPRAVRDLAIAGSFEWDYELAHYMNYETGFAHSGAAYTPARVFLDLNNYVKALSNIPTFPSMGQTTPWMQNQSLYKMFGALPDIRDGLVTSMGWGTDNQNCTYAPQISARILCATGYLLDPTFFWNPNSANAKYLRNWMENITPASPQIWNHTGAAVDSMAFAPLLHIDPRQPTSDYTVQPHQYLFQASSYATCAALTGWPCPQTFRGDAVISRGGSWTDKTSSFLYLGARAWYDDHDNPSNGMVTIYQVGELMTRDAYPTWDSSSQGTPDDSIVGMSPRFGDAYHFKGGIFNSQPGITPITRWASGNHGTWDTAYGDQNSTYVYTCTDLAGAYDIAINHALRCVGHLKKPGTEGIIFVQDDIDVSSAPTQVEVHFHYPQNGETVIPGVLIPSSYSEGDTTCPGSGGCPSLNTNRTILEVESGAASDAHGPARTYGLISKFFSPATITLRDDAAANTVTVSSVRKTATVAISSYVTGAGFITTVNTSADHNLISGEVVMFTGVAGTGCGGSSAFNNGVFTWPVTVTGVRSFTIPFDSRSICTSPSSGNVTTITLFSATAHGLINGATVKVAGATGSWAVWNQASMIVEVVDADHFNEYWLSSPDTSAYGTSFDGTISRFYAGGLGHTHRVSVCAGSSCGATVTSLESLAVLKLSSNYLTDTTLTATAITPDANWYGVQTLDKVIILARHGVTQSTMAGFTTTHNGTAQYLIGGITAGSGYAITINGTPVTGSPFTVAAGDNSIEFESTAGVFALNGGAPAGGRAPVVGGKFGAGGKVVVH